MTNAEKRRAVPRAVPQRRQTGNKRHWETGTTKMNLSEFSKRSGLLLIGFRPGFGTGRTEQLSIVRALQPTDETAAAAAAAATATPSLPALLSVAYSYTVLSSVLSSLP